MKFLEKNLEDIIFNTPSDILDKRGLYVPRNRIRQLRVGNYGTIDILAYTRIDTEHYGNVLDINIYELKKDIIDVNSFLQILRYWKGVKTYLEKRNIEFVSVGLYLIGSELDTKSDLVYLPDLFSEYYHELFNLHILTYSYEFDGIKFTNQYGYHLTNDGFGIIDKKALKKLAKTPNFNG